MYMNQVQGTFFASKNCESWSEKQMNFTEKHVEKMTEEMIVWNMKRNIVKLGRNDRGNNQLAWKRGIKENNEIVRTRSCVDEW